MGIRQRFWDSMYRGTPTWELGGPDPELVGLLDQGRIGGPGRALDLGCGTGNDVVELARRGWTVSGVDVSDRALARAREKAAVAGVEPDLRNADVTRLPGLDGPFDLIVDRGLLMSLFGERARRAYTHAVTALTAPGSVVYQHQWVLPEEPSPLSRAWLATRLNGFVLTPGELEARFGSAFAIEPLTESLEDTDDPGIRRLGIPRVVKTSWLLRRR